MSDCIYIIKHIKHYEEKRKFLLFMFILFFFLFLSFYLFKIAYARYEVHSKINANINKALYILDTGEQSFNLEPDGIVPSNKSYVYKFSISNFNETKETDVDIYYDLKIITTTNLPITIKLYRNEVYDNTNSTNLFESSNVVQDSDGAWYNIYRCPDTYEMYYKDRTTDVYTLVIDFPKDYSKNIDFENYIESIEVNIKSRQMQVVLWSLLGNIES